VLFGGRDSAARQGDTWEWDGTNWTLMATTGPSPRSPGTLSYDAQTRYTVLFGGLDANGVDLNDIWLWNGSAWRQVTSASTPAIREQHSMIYDSDRHVTVLYGGFQTNPQAFLKDTWEGSPEYLLGDLNLDGVVSLSDLGTLLAHYGASGGPADG